MSAAAVMAAIQMAGTALQGLGAWQASRTQERAFKDRARINELDAVEVQKASEYEASQITLEGRKLRARQLVQQAKSGILTGSPTARLVREETTSQSQRDAAFATDDGAKAASRLRLQAIYERQMAASTKMQAIWGMLSGGVQGAQQLYSTGKDAGWWSKSK